MASPYIGEIRQWPGSRNQLNGWQLCDGSLLSISENETLYALIGTTYGGDGQSTFAVPNLQGRVPVHQGAGLTLGSTGGSESVTLNTGQLPTHSHTPMVATSSPTNSPAGNVWGPASGLAQPYGPAPGTVGMNAQSVSVIGGNQPHENRIPYLAINYIIATVGIWPAQS